MRRYHGRSPWPSSIKIGCTKQVIDVSSGPASPLCATGLVGAPDSPPPSTSQHTRPPPRRKAFVILPGSRGLVGFIPSAPLASHPPTLAQWPHLDCSHLIINMVGHRVRLPRDCCGVIQLPTLFTSSAWQRRRSIYFSACSCLQRQDTKSNRH